MSDFDNSFDTVFKQFKDNTKPMCELMGCPELAEDFIVDVEINRQSFKSFYEAGQQSKQAEIDELNLKINRLIDSEENIARSCEGWRDAHRELDERIIKALSLIKDEVIAVDYDEYRFVGNFVDADKLKEILE